MPNEQGLYDQRRVKIMKGKPTENRINLKGIRDIYTNNCEAYILLIQAIYMWETDVQLPLFDRPRYLFP